MEIFSRAHFRDACWCCCLLLLAHDSWWNNRKEMKPNNTSNDFQQTAALKPNVKCQNGQRNKSQSSSEPKVESMSIGVVYKWRNKRRRWLYEQIGVIGCKSKINKSKKWAIEKKTRVHRSAAQRRLTALALVDTQLTPPSLSQLSQLSEQQFSLDSLLASVGLSQALLPALLKRGLHFGRNTTTTTYTTQHSPAQCVHRCRERAREQKRKKEIIKKKKEEEEDEGKKEKKGKNIYIYKELHPHSLGTSTGQQQQQPTRFRSTYLHNPPPPSHSTLPFLVFSLYIFSFIFIYIYIFFFFLRFNSQVVWWVACAYRLILFYFILFLFSGPCT